MTPMPASNRSRMMPVKHWSFAGLVLTTWCNARCASCYLRCGPDPSEGMATKDALRWWDELIAASPHGCRIHLSGGEPFGDYPALLDLCRQAAAAGLAPLEKIETNAFWASEERVVRDRLRELDAAGMGRLTISADPYHQQYVPIERCRLAARVAEEVLGPARVQIRWRDWLAEGRDTGDLAGTQLAELFARYAAGGRDRLNGRAAETIAPHLPLKPAASFAGCPCRENLLRSRHVHIEPGGYVTPGVCAGILLGRLDRQTVGELWRDLVSNHAERPILGELAREGPVGLLSLAEKTGYRPQAGYAGKCHLCYDLRRHLFAHATAPAELGPGSFYG